VSTVFDSRHIGQSCGAQEARAISCCICNSKRRADILAVHPQALANPQWAIHRFDDLKNRDPASRQGQGAPATPGSERECVAAFAKANG
jgi:hypothetical protein